MEAVMNPLNKEFTFASLLRFALPSMVMMLLMGCYTIMDTILVSQLINTDALSALNIVCPVINLLVGFGTMLASGGSALIAKEMGCGNMQAANQKFTLITLFCICSGFIIALLGILFLEPLLWKLGASTLLFPYGKGYLQVILLFAPACMLQVLFQSMIIAAGRPGLGMVLSIGAGLLNVALDYLFLVGFDMGIQGSALGTGIGYLAPTLIGFYFFAAKKGTLSFTTPKLQLSVLFHSCANGCSEMISQASAAVTTFLFNITVMKLQGEQGVAAITIMIYMQFLLTTLYIGYSMGVAPIFSYAFGARQSERLHNLFKHSFTFILGLSILTCLLCLCYRSTLIQLFTPPGTRVYELAYSGFYLFSFSFLCCGVNIFSSALFTALSNGKLSALISFLRTFGFLAIGILLFSRSMGMQGIWLAVPVAEAGALIISLLSIKCSFFHKVS